MASPWHKLPLEVWSIVFYQVGSVKALAECRLVCKAWDPLVERAMFSQKLVFIKGDTITKFYNHLVKRPSLGQSINEMYFYRLHTTELGFEKHFFELAFTPNIRKIEGEISKELLRYLLEIARNSDKEFSKLESLPRPPYEFTDTHAAAFLYFRKSLVQLHLTISRNDNEAMMSILNRLNEFENLNELSLEFYRGINDLMELENILRKCPRLLTLELEVDWERNVLMETAELKEWAKSNVEQSPNACVLNLGGESIPEIIEYLLYRYPNSRCATIGHYSSTEGSVPRILKAIKELDYVTLHTWYMPNMEVFKSYASTMKSRRNTIAIRPSPHYEGIIISVDATRFNGTSEFSMEISKDASLSEIITAIGGVCSLDIIYFGAEEGTSSFFKLLHTTPQIEKLGFMSAYIEYQPSLVNSLVLKQLRSLSLSGAIVDEEVIPTLSKIATRLEHLTFETCLLDFKCHQDHRIIMPQSKLSSLSILATENAWLWFGPEYQKVIGALKWMQKSIILDKYQLMFLQIRQSSIKQTHYFVLKIGTPSRRKQISKEEYQKNINQWPKIVIECKSLKQLKLDLGALVIDMDLGIETSIENIGDWKVDQRRALLSHLHERNDA